MIDEIQSVIAEEFGKRNLEVFSKNLNPTDLSGWADSISAAYRLDKETFNVQVREFFWAFSAIQISLGYIMMSLREVSFPSGTVGSVINEETVPDLNQLADYHYWYHMSNTWESIYRLWERIVTVLELRFTPNLSGLYFDGYLNYIREHDVLPTADLRKLEKHHKHWNKITEKRNEISHGKSNPFLNIDFDVSLSKIIDNKGNNFAWRSYQYPNLKQEVNMVINYYRHSYRLLEATKDICELNIEPNKALHRTSR